MSHFSGGSAEPRTVVSGRRASSSVATAYSRAASSSRLTCWKMSDQVWLTWSIARTRVVARYVVAVLHITSAARVTSPSADPATAARASTRDAANFASISPPRTSGLWALSDRPHHRPGMPPDKPFPRGPGTRGAPGSVRRVAHRGRAGHLPGTVDRLDQDRPGGTGGFFPPGGGGVPPAGGRRGARGDRLRARWRAAR